MDKLLGDFMKGSTKNIENALAALKNGKMIVIFDGEDREGEADLVFSARFATQKKIETLRKYGGGLICAAIEKKSADYAGLPFFTDILEKSGTLLNRISCRKTAYGDKPAFSLPINHCNVYTGITDNDRALTIRKLDEAVHQGMRNFAKHFYAPGHVFLLIGRGLKNRRGHTELALELARRSGLNGVMVLCEMLGRGNALSKEGAKKYAQVHKLVFMEGKEIIRSV